MNRSSKQLIKLSKKIVEEMDFQNLRYATVGGSVGRGDADIYSDLDLNIYVSGGGLPYDRIFVYEGEVVQLFVTNHLPTEEQVRNNPWRSRFISEEVAIHDPLGDFFTLKEWVNTYFSSKEGRERLAEQAIDIVKIRKKWAIDSINQGNYYSAKLGAASAWADAAFFYLFFAHNTLSTGSLIPLTKNLKSNYEEYCRILPFAFDLLTEGVGEILRIVERHREFLRVKYPSLSQGSSLSPLQDILMLRKAQRLYQEQQFENILWQLSGEVFMLFIECTEGKLFEDYYQSLPQTMQDDLTKLGFIALDEVQVMEICQLSDQLVNCALQFAIR